MARIASAALIFALRRRPWRTWRPLDTSTRRLLLAWGAVLAVMNACFYLAIDRLPLGTPPSSSSPSSPWPPSPPAPAATSPP